LQALSPDQAANSVYLPIEEGSTAIDAELQHLTPFQRVPKSLFDVP